MNSIALVFKKDLRHFWLLLLLWFAVLPAQVALSAWHSGAVPGFLITLASCALLGLRILMLAIAIPIIVQDDPLNSDKAFWMTRPISGSALFFEKLLFIIAFFVIPQVAAESLAMFLNGVPSGIVLGAGAPEMLLANLAIVVPMALLASMTRSLAGYAIWGLAVIAVKFALSFGFVILRAFLAIYGYGRSFAKFMDFGGKPTAEPVNIFDLSPLAATAPMVSALLLSLLGALLLFVQYRTRRTKRVAWLAALLLISACVVNSFWAWDFLKKDAKPRFNSETSKSISVSDICMENGGNSLRGALLPEGLSPEHFVRYKEAMFKIKYTKDQNRPPKTYTVPAFAAKSEALLAFATPAGADGKKPSSFRLDMNRLSSALGGVKIMNASPKPYLMPLMEISMNSPGAGKFDGMLSGDVTFSVYEYKPLASLPLVLGAYQKLPDGMIVMKNARWGRMTSNSKVANMELVDSLTCEIAMKTANLFLANGSKASFGNLIDIMTRDVYVLVNRKAGEAYLPDSLFPAPFNILMAIFIGGPQKRLSTVNALLVFNKLPVSDKWMSNAEIAVFRIVDEGTIRGHLEMNDLALDKEAPKAEKPVEGSAVN